MQARLFIFILFSFLLLFSSCELIVIGQKYSEPEPALTRKDAYGVIAMWKAELDTGNTLAACEMLSGVNGEKLLATQQIEFEFELSRINNILKKRKVTLLRADTLSKTKLRYFVEYGYTKRFSFITSLGDSLWTLSSWEQVY